MALWAYHLGSPPGSVTSESPPELGTQQVQRAQKSGRLGFRCC